MRIGPIRLGSAFKKQCIELVQTLDDRDTRIYRWYFHKPVRTRRRLASFTWAITSELSWLSMFTALYFAPGYIASEIG
jgi:hypothetical protein